ncbi:DUF6262 family protein [Candidatus Poriferisodalis sp.]|uniref:DUF6262 family protein n=1 Tax=Candidatus Poriferisodalis sp. TaxID=3101277 RepID=UPI003B5B9456
MTTNVETVEAACARLANHGQAITFTAVAEHARISRTTLYRNPQLRAIVDEHRHHSHDPHTLTALAAEIAHLRTGLEALADRTRNHEERLRHLEHRQPRRKAN